MYYRSQMITITLKIWFHKLSLSVELSLSPGPVWNNFEGSYFGCRQKVQMIIGSRFQINTGFCFINVFLKGYSVCNFLVRYRSDSNKAYTNYKNRCDIIQLHCIHFSHHVLNLTFKCLCVLDSTFL